MNIARAAVLLGVAWSAASGAFDARGDEGATVIAGPAMGTTWRVTLSGSVAGMTTGEVHREIEAVLGRIDRAASTWRDDSDVTRFNRAAAGAWVEVAPDLAAIIDLARRIHDESGGGFDITVAPLVRLWRTGPVPTATEIEAARSRVGMEFLRVRRAEGDRPAAIMKTRAGVEIDLDGIAPGYAVDRIGERLASLGSEAHLVELGGEVRAWGRRSADAPWRAAVRCGDAGNDRSRVVELAAGRALATSTIRPGRGGIDPRSGRPVQGPCRSVTVIADSCAAADAWAVAAVVLGLEPDAGGLVSAVRAPSMRAALPAATPAGP